MAGALSRSLSSAGWSGSRIAHALGTTDASISYYLKFKRGTQPLPPSAMNMCMKLSQKIASGKIKEGQIGIEMAKIAVLARHDGQPKMQKQMLSLCKSCLSPRLVSKMPKLAH